MPILSLVAIYFIVWWLCLFLILPFGVKSQIEQSSVIAPGTEAGAPWRSHIRKKLLATTLLSFVVMWLSMWLLSNPVLQEYWR